MRFLLTRLAVSADFLSALSSSVQAISDNPQQA